MREYSWSPRKTQHEINTQFFAQMHREFSTRQAGFFEELFEVIDARIIKAMQSPEPRQRPSQWDAVTEDAAQRLEETIERLKNIGREWFGDEHFPGGSFSA